MGPAGGQSIKRQSFCQARATSTHVVPLAVCANRTLHRVVSQERSRDRACQSSNQVSGSYEERDQRDLPDETLPMPRENAKIGNRSGGRLGSSSADRRHASACQQERNFDTVNPRAIMVIRLVQIAEKLRPSIPNMTTKAMSTPVLVANPHRKMQERAVPKQESEMTSRSEILSERYPSKSKPGIEEAAITSGEGEHMDMTR